MRARANRIDEAEVYSGLSDRHIEDLTVSWRHPERGAVAIDVQDMQLPTTARQFNTDMGSEGVVVEQVDSRRHAWSIGRPRGQLSKIVSGTESSTLGRFAAPAPTAL